MSINKSTIIDSVQVGSTTHEIVPNKLTDTSESNYAVTVPTLTQDETIAFKSDISAIGNPMIFKGTATVTKSGSSYTVSVATPSLTSVKDGYVYKITTAPENDDNFKVGDTLIANKNNPGSNPQANWSLIPSGDDAGSILDVEVGGTSIVTSGVANIATGSTYNASTNPIATMADIPQPYVGYTLQGPDPVAEDEFGYYIDLTDEEVYLIDFNADIPEATDFKFGQIIYKYDAHMDSLESIWYFDRIDANDSNKIIVQPLGKINGAVYKVNADEFDYDSVVGNKTKYNILSPYLIQAVKNLKILEVTFDATMKFYPVTKSENTYSYQSYFVDLDGTEQISMLCADFTINDSTEQYYFLVYFKKFTPISRIAVNGTDVTPSLGRVSLTIPSLPTYTSSNNNYVLSVDSNGALVWRAPYNGAASGS